jgi:hypothetical protein
VTPMVEIPGGSAGTALVQEGNVVRMVRMGAMMITGENTDERTVERLESLARLCQWAHDNNFTTVSWG